MQLNIVFHSVSSYLRRLKGSERHCNEVDDEMLCCNWFPRQFYPAKRWRPFFTNYKVNFDEVDRRVLVEDRIFTFLAY